MTSSCRVAVGDASTSPGRWHAVWVRANVIATRGTCSCRAARREAVRPPTLASSWCAAAFMSRDFLCPPSRESFWSSRRRPRGTACGTPPRRRRRCATTTPASRGTRPRCSPRTSRPGGPCVLDVGWPGPTGPRGAGRSSLRREPWTRTLSFRHRGAWTCALRGTTPRRTTGPSTTRTFSPKRIPRTKRRWLSRDDGYGPRARRSV